MSNFDFDQLLATIGGFGNYQILLFIILGSGYIPCGWQTLLMVFIGGQHEHRCSGKHATDSSSGGSVLTPVNISDAFVRQCMYYNSNYTEVGNGTVSGYMVYENESSLSLTMCDKWEYDVSGYTSTIRSKWDLVCNKEYLVALASSIYMTGFLTGAVTFGTISDIYGRKKALLASIVLQILSSLSAALTSQYGHYVPFVILRFLAGNATAGCITVSFVLIMEIAGVKYRMYLGALVACWFAAGFAILCGIAYFVRDHFFLQLAVAMPTVFLLSYIWLVPESPRWLYAENRPAEAEVIMRTIAKRNNKPFPTELQKFYKKEKYDIEHNERATLLNILGRPRMRTRLLIMSFCWFVCSFVYYGLSYNTGSLGGNVYVNTVINALMEIPACIMVCFVLNRFGRRWILLATSFLAGISLLASIPGLNNPGLQTYVVVLSNIGKFGSSAAFAVVYVFTAELFPTVVRNVALGTGSTCARVGSLLAPQLIHLDKYVWFGFSSVLMGSLPLVAGILGVLLPETNRMRLPETLTDGESFGTTEYKRAFTQDYVNLEGKSSKADLPLKEQEAVTETM